MFKISQAMFRQKYHRMLKIVLKYIYIFIQIHFKHKTHRLFNNETAMWLYQKWCLMG